ncbi:LytTR family DNA-binding domain-containing protein [Pseudoflavonifractor phocaeensis]|uniref:LytTR family DNA-binding domain-containing protein n=1 Tax=Pseudoflavonifractor phocaeensis TaxID=1870988 RepID=UPI001956E668|nr:LytTR family DNA-binding domain-containing protein [Pseudoflavonifractor phocaeensis]MBM6721753.1 LytTR family transcriptional regulator [Pseudoflavonifractor phocaeensis]MBM6884806.1 LytTR family transcriptional regulator [Pseudoflavonifractor phocaeensis]
MKVDIHIEPGCGEISVTITAPALTDQVKALAVRLQGGGVLTGWRGDVAVPLAAAEILRCYGEEKGVKVQTTQGVYDLKERLYELESKLDRHTFVRISHSELVNLEKVTALDLSLTGTIRMTLAEDTVCYVSRRYVKKIKEALGL